MSTLATPAFEKEWSISEIADWVELTASGSRREFLQGALHTTITREGDAGQDPAAVAAEAWAELDRRQHEMGDAWPMRLRGARLDPRSEHPNRAFHFFVCALSLGDLITQDARRLFEHCVTELIGALSGGYGIRIGYPRSAGMPSSLDEAVNMYVRLSREEKRKPLLATDNDFGLDVVSWRRFCDERGGYLHFIGQCATGKNWYEEHKHMELQLDRWAEHIGWSVKPVRFLAVPHVVPPSRWRRACIDGGLVLDRARLLRLAMAKPLRRRRHWQVLSFCRSVYADEAA